MNVVSSIKDEVCKAPLATVIALIALAISIFGSPLDGGPLSTKSPSVVVTGEYVERMQKGEENIFRTNVLFENVGENAANVRLEALMWDDSGKKIEILNRDGDEPTFFEIHPKGEKGILAETAVFPSTLVVCLVADSLQGFGTGEFSGVYEASYEGAVTNFKLGNKAMFSSQIVDCQSSLN